jgi:16S rRNA processing protein RimM
MDQQPHLKKIGFISKLNGYKGELVLATDEDDIFEEEFLFMKMDGIAVPFFVEEIFEKGGSVVVKFEGVNDEAQALRFVKQEVFISQKKKAKENKKADPASLQELVNYHLVDSVSGDLGPIIRIDEFPQQQIAVCVIKEKEIMIPLNDDFIDEVDSLNRRIMVTLPEGLLEINK